MSNIQKTGSSFSIKKFLKARELTKNIVADFSKQVTPGFTEEFGNSLIEALLNSYGAEKKWHPNKFRIGINTTKSFRDKSEPEQILKENDIYFIDIGPVFEGHEGDYGETFVVGESRELSKIVEASKIVFNKTASIWQSKGLTGEELYIYAEKTATDLGFKLNNKMKGHRVGDFPHHVYYKGGMSETKEVPCDNLWILEIHLISNCETYGAFYEDILQK